ncbi:222_t:CDS:2, partial [Ambispora leptoticha]
MEGKLCVLVNMGNCVHPLFASLSARSLSELLEYPFTFFALGVIISVSYVFVKALYGCLAISKYVDMTI